MNWRRLLFLPEKNEYSFHYTKIHYKKVGIIAHSFIRFARNDI